MPGINTVTFIDNVPNPQLDDKDIVHIIDWKNQSEIRPEKTGLTGELRTLWLQWDRLRVINGILYRVWKVDHNTIRYQYVVPKGKRREIFQQMHDSEFGGHFGTTGTTGKIEPKYYWPGLHKQIENYVQNCGKCQEAKIRGLLNRAPLQPIITSRPFQLVTCDILGPFPATVRGTKYILVFMCHFTKWVEMYGLNTLEAIEVAQCLIDLICRHGVPEGLLSDQGRNFESNLFKDVLDLLDVHKVRTTPYHPQCDGQTERFNRTLLSMLKVYVNENQDDWDLLLNKLAFAYRTAVHRTTGQTPFEMVYGRQPKLPLDICLPSEVEPIELDHEAYVKELKERLELMFNYVKQNTEVKIEKAKIAYDRKVRCSSYQIGDKVWLLNCEKKKGTSPKLAKAWKGPYVIIDKIGPVNYKIKMPNGTKRSIVHINRLKKCFMATNVSEGSELPASQNDDFTQVVSHNAESPILRNPPSACAQSMQTDTANRLDAISNDQAQHQDESIVRPHDSSVSKAEAGPKAKRGRPKKSTATVIKTKVKNQNVPAKQTTPARIQPSRKVKRN
jgi:hypothetical protein